MSLAVTLKKDLLCEFAADDKTEPINTVVAQHAMQSWTATLYGKQPLARSKAVNEARHTRQFSFRDLLPQRFHTHTAILQSCVVPCPHEKVQIFAALLINNAILLQGGNSGKQRSRGNIARQQRLKQNRMRQKVADNQTYQQSKATTSLNNHYKRHTANKRQLTKDSGRLQFNL